MSNLDDIKGLVARYDLIAVEDRELRTVQKYRRWIYVRPQAHEEMSNRGDHQTFRRLSVLFQMFITGETISAALHRNHKKAQWARLMPSHHEIWETRVKNTTPELRILGRFACVDVFVAFHIYEGWELKGRTWETAKARCQSEWSELFHGAPVHSGDLHAYISANVTPV
jgi:hypothetical protein